MSYKKDIRRRSFFSFFVSLIILFLFTMPVHSSVVREDGKVYIVDRRGERWDVTQAESIGFKPEGFQYGLGRNHFTPLDDSLLTEEKEGIDSGLRVLGVKEGDDAKAYSIPKLSGHEIANSRIGNKPIAVGY